MLVWLMLATTGPVGGIGGQPLPLGAIVGGLVIVLVPYGLAVIVAARRGRLGTGRDEIRSQLGPPSSTVSVQAALSWLAEGPARRSVVLTGGGGRHVALEPSAHGPVLAGFDGITPVGPLDVGPMVAEVGARRLLAADLEQLVGGRMAPIVATFELVGGQA